MFPDMAVKAADLKTEIRATGWVRAGSGSGDATERSLAGWDLAGFGRICQDFGAVLGVILKILYLLSALHCQGRSKFGPLRRSKSRPVGEGVAVFVGRLERSLRSAFRAAQA